ncbi:MULTISPECIES: hypothetical protein [Nocardia]|uniref:hypothetical protein n=1 Tax=Nocardia TaxID=1817 RepID=UPI002456B367|nr:MULTISPECIES: hypothetical protein [Nocardia]
MNSVLLQFLFGAGCIAIGYVTGLSMSWREYKLGDKAFAAPSLPRTEKKQALWLIVVALMAVVSTAYAGVQTVRQAECNREFRQSLVARSAITVDNQRHLDDMMNAVAESISNPQPDSRDRARLAILDYQRWAKTAEKRRAENPITDPVCGAR